MSKKADKVSVELSVYHWHLLLKELEYNMQVVNRDIQNPGTLYQEIATQLSDVDVNVVGVDK